MVVGTLNCSILVGTLKSRQGVRQGARQVSTNILGFKVPTTMWQHGVRGARQGTRQVCCLSLSLPPHGGGDLKFQYGGGDTKIQYKMLYGHGPREQDKGARQGSETGTEMGARQVCCLSLPLPPHGGGTLNSSMVVGTLKFSIKYYMGHGPREQDREQDKR